MGQYFISVVRPSGMVEEIRITNNQGQIDVPKVVDVFNNEKLLNTPDLLSLLIEIIKNLSPGEALRLKKTMAAPSERQKDPQKDLLNDLVLEQREGPGGG